MPRRYLFKVVWLTCRLIVGGDGPRIYPHWRKDVHIRIVADLTKGIGTTSPELASVRVTRVVHEEQSVIFAASDLVNIHVNKTALDLIWLYNSVSVWITKAQLALIGISTAKDLILVCNKDWVSTASLHIFNTFITELLLFNPLWSVNIFKPTLLIWCHS